MKYAVFVFHLWRELRNPKDTFAYFFEKCRMRKERAAWVFVGVEDTDTFMNLFGDNSYRLCKIGVIRDDDSQFDCWAGAVRTS